MNSCQYDMKPDIFQKGSEITFTCSETRALVSVAYVSHIVKHAGVSTWHKFRCIYFNSIFKTTEYTNDYTIMHWAVELMCRDGPVLWSMWVLHQTFVFNLPVAPLKRHRWAWRISAASLLTRTGAGDAWIWFFRYFARLICEWRRNRTLNLNFKKVIIRTPTDLMVRWIAAPAEGRTLRPPRWWGSSRRPEAKRVSGGVLYKRHSFRFFTAIIHTRNLL